MPAPRSRTCGSSTFSSANCGESWRKPLAANITSRPCAAAATCYATRSAPPRNCSAPDICLARPLRAAQPRPRPNSLVGTGRLADHRETRADRSPAPHSKHKAQPMTESYLRSGIFLAPFHNHNENPTLSIERDFELLQHLDRLNYNEAWVGEHHSGGFEVIACPEMFIAAAAERTRHIRLGTGVVSLPYHNPFILADRMIQLDHMTRGRAMFGVGPGALVHDALKQGIQPADQRRMMNESLDVVVRLLPGETVPHKTDWFTLVEARLQVPSYSQPTMELAVAAARSPAGGLAAGKYGIGRLSIGGPPPRAPGPPQGEWGVF